jgi:hypothetical protein
MKKPQSELVLTSLWVEPAAYDTFKKRAIADGTTAAERLRGFIRLNAREVAPDADAALVRRKS